MIDIQEKANIVFRILDENSPKEIEFLQFSNPFELLISVVLSAQTTDNQVNKVTKELFGIYPTPSHLAQAQREDVERIIKSTGFYKMKAKHIIAAADVLVKDFSSIVPLTIEELITIPGVGRKSANVIVGRVAHKGAIIVDTHFLRVVNRLGLVETKDPYKIEMSIKKLIDEKRQYRFSMIVNLHGRRVCFARTPSCSDCLVSHVCNYTLNS